MSKISRNNRLKTAIVGCGKVAGTHALAYQSLSYSELVAVCDVSSERVKAFAKKLGVNAYTDLAEMLKSEKVDVLSVCTQHTQHPAAVESAAAAGVHAISEKPLAIDLASLSPEQRKALKAAANALDIEVLHSIVKQLRPQHLHLAQDLESLIADFRFDRIAFANFVCLIGPIESGIQL